MTRGRPPKPTKVLELNGAFKKDPQRKRAREKEPQPKGPIEDGGFPGHRGLTEADAYQWILETVPEGVLTRSDEIELTMAAKLLCKVMTGVARSIDYQLLGAKLGKFGMNPSDRARLQLGQKEKPKNRWAKG